MQPHASELEEAIIGACLIEQEALPLVADKLRPEMFYDNHHQLIFAALIAMYQANKKIDILTVKEELTRRGVPLLFAATDAGLASCWVHVNGRPCLKDQPDGAQAEDYLREFLPVPAEHGILCAVALGYSDFEPAALPPFDAGTHIHWPEK